MDPPTVNENDTICIQPQIFCPQPKLPLIQIDFNVLKKSGTKGSEANRNVDSFVLALSDARKAFVAALQTTETSKETFDKSLQEYISLLLVLIDGPAAPSLPDTQAASSSQPSTSALDCSPDTFKKESALRYAVKFSWTQSFVARGPVTAGDALYELASVLISAAVALIRHVNTKYLESTPRGVTSKSSGEAYKLLREAAGLLEYAATSVAPRIESPLPEVDTSDYVLKAAVNCTLADAQSISVLRAIKKGNQSALIASLARDTCDLYASAETLLASYPKAVGSKLDEYMKYKAAAFEAYAHVFSGITAWKARQLGGALRCLMDAESAFFSAKKAASVFDKAMPVSLGHVHARFDDVRAAACFFLYALSYFNPTILLTAPLFLTI